MRKKQNNKGFTLVELLIAITILTVITIPLLGNFVVSSKMNFKSKKTMNATIAGQNIMEGFTAFRAEDIILEFAKEMANSNPNLEFMPNRMKCDQIGQMSVNITNKTDKNSSYGLSQSYDLSLPYITITTDDDGNDRIVGFADQKGNRDLSDKLLYESVYSFWLKDVELGNDQYEYDKHDIVLTLDGRDPLPPIGSGDNMVNDVEISKISSINKQYDCLWYETDQNMADAVAAFTSRLNHNNPTNIEKKITSKMIVNIRTSEVDGNTEYTVDIEYEYTFNATSELVNSSDNKYVPAAPEAIFSSKEYGMKPRNIYIYYLPNYYVTDLFEINNPGKIPVNLYITRTEIDGVTNVAVENTYSCAVNVEEPIGTGVQTKLFTNLDLNIAMYKIKVGSTYQPLANLDVARWEECKRTGTTQYTLGGYPAIDGVSVTSERYLNVLGLHGEVKEDRVFKVTMQIYKAKALENGLPEADLLTTLTGTIRR